MSKLLMPSHFLELDNQVEDEELRELTTTRLDGDSTQVVMAADDALDDF